MGWYCRRLKIVDGYWKLSILLQRGVTETLSWIRSLER